jgi:hypothetical protein
MQQQVSNQEQARHAIPIQNDANRLESNPNYSNSRSAYWANASINPDTGASMEYRHLLKSLKHGMTWTMSFANELG